MVKELDKISTPQNAIRVTSASSLAVTGTNAESTKKAAVIKNVQEAPKALSDEDEEALAKEREELSKGKYVNFGKIVTLVRQCFAADTFFF